MKIGERLIEAGVIDENQLNEALKIQEQTGSSLGKILTSKGHMEHQHLDRVLAEQLGLPFIHILDRVIEEEVVDQEKLGVYIKYEFIPIGHKEFAICNPSPETIKILQNKYGEDISFFVTPKEELMFKLHFTFKTKTSHDSIYALAETYPDYSAGKVFITKQLYVIYFICLVTFSFLVLMPSESFFIINVIIIGLLLISFIFKFILIWLGSKSSSQNMISEAEINDLDDKELPLYTVLVPMFNEPDVLPILVDSLRKLNYPKEKLEVKLVLEEIDQVTIDAARALKLEDIFEIIIVPDSQPRTKPKACNYALYFCKGKYLTIYDAEDKPERNQLKAALATFKKSSDRTAVVQSRLNYYNDDENILTRNFTLEYSVWFDFFLPGLDRLKVPIPLGGTSNHFVTKYLRHVGGWDPFNVTEDADLGIRFHQLKYNVKIVNSTTYEEANTQVGNWIRQRSRWMKGYMQTYLVHMRAPYQFYRTVGAKGFFSFQFFIGMTILTALLTPFLYGIFFSWLLTATDLFDPSFDPMTLYLSHLGLLLGNSFFIYIMMIGVLERESKHPLIPYALTVPIYWILMSIAAYKGLIQLFLNPFYWEKTQHGLSKVTQQEIEKLA